VHDENHWRAETRAVEDRLSDALHGALTQRFVDRRTSLLLRRLKQKETLVAEVNDKGEVTVEGEFAGRLDGFRFVQDHSESSEAAQTLRTAAMEALRPELHLRADRFYNAPDTELDFTTQGGLMWGNSAVGKLVKGTEPQRPAVTAFVDDEAGDDVREKVTRRLQHFIDRKIAAGFEPMLAMGRDETLTGLARGFAFRLTEAMGVIVRDAVANEVKELDQEARGALRKHGVRFGQYTIFMPLLLKPAPTRLRLVLWSLWNGLDEFPESPPPGLVTIPNLDAVPRSHYTLSGYHPAGARALRIDMLERLADILRGKDSRAGFEAAPEMLSITGMTLEQFNDLMGGLGYKGERGERAKVKSGPVPVVVDPDAVINPITEEESAFVHPEPDAAPEMEVFYTFTWAPKRSPRVERPAPNRRDAPEGQTDRPRSDKPRGERPAGDRPRGDKPRGDKPAGNRPRGDKPRGDKPYADKGNRGPRDDNKPKTFEQRPPRVEKPIDPDNPFAVLMALKNKV
jgi:ATP-dependent RNA helicase SUPV3L1/SUV3